MEASSYIKNIYEYIIRHPIVFLFSFAVFVQLLLILIFPLPNHLGGDFALYDRIAQSIILEGDFGGEPFKTYKSPSITPGWSFFLAGFYLIFGDSYMALLMVSAVFGGLLSVGVYLLARHFFEKKIAFISGITAALWPAFLIQAFVYTNSLLFYTLLLLYSTLLFAKAQETSNWVFIIISGGLLGFAALTDSIAFFVPLVFFVWALVRHFSFHSFKMAVLLLITFMLILAPWSYRNMIAADNLNSTVTPVIAKGELKLASPDNLLYISKLVIRDGVLLSGLSKMFIFPFNISLLDQYTDLFYKDAILRFVRGERSVFSSQEIIILGSKSVITLFHWLLLILSLGAFFITANKRFKSFLIFIALLLLYITAATIGYGSLNQNDFGSISALNSFLFPLLPFFIILASFSISFLYKKYFQDRFRSLCFLLHIKRR